MELYDDNDREDGRGEKFLEQIDFGLLSKSDIVQPIFWEMCAVDPDGGHVRELVCVDEYKNEYRIDHHEPP